MLMNRHLTDEELENTGEGNLVGRVSVVVFKAIEAGILRDCEVVKPLVTDEGDLLEAVNSKLGTDAELMYYIPIIGTESNFMQEAYNLKPLIKSLSNDFEGSVFEDRKFLMCINSVSLLGKNNPNPVHNIVFMMKELPEGIDLDSLPDEDEANEIIAELKESVTDTNLVS